MMCRKCGHSEDSHEKPGSPFKGCWRCHRWNVPNTNKFWDHSCETNLEFLERKSKEKENVH